VRLVLFHLQIAKIYLVKPRRKALRLITENRLSGAISGDQRTHSVSPLFARRCRATVVLGTAEACACRGQAGAGRNALGVPALMWNWWRVAEAMASANRMPMGLSLRATA
jgi:hypothetical protein